MLFAIIATDKPGSFTRRKQARPAHIARLEILNDQGRLLLAGPHPLSDNGSLDDGVSGSLIVAEFESLKAAKSWAAEDPYVKADVYADVLVKPFIKVLP